MINAQARTWSAMVLVLLVDAPISDLGENLDFKDKILENLGDRC